MLPRRREPPPPVRHTASRPAGQPVAAAVWPAQGALPPTVRKYTTHGTSVVHYVPTLDAAIPKNMHFLSDRKKYCQAHHPSGLDCRNGFIELNFRMSVKEFGDRLASVAGVTSVGFGADKPGTDDHEQRANYRVHSKRCKLPFEFELTRSGHKQEMQPASGSRVATNTAQFLSVNHWEPSMLKEGYRILCAAVMDSAMFPTLVKMFQDQHIRWWNERLHLPNRDAFLLGHMADEAMLEFDSDEEETAARPASGSQPASSSAEQPANSSAADTRGTPQRAGGAATGPSGHRDVASNLTTVGRGGNPAYAARLRYPGKAITP